MTQSTRQLPEVLLEALRGQADLALAKLHVTAISRNPSIKGSSREEVIREFIRCFLPSSYAIGHGEVFSERNERSKQIDVIIHDELFSPVFKTADGGILVPCEAVYGSAEVKTRLDKTGWCQALENIASIKRLKRSPSEMTDILPSRRLHLGPSLTMTRPERPHNPYMGVVMGMMEKGRGTITKVIPDRSGDSLMEHIEDHAAEGSEIHTDEHRGYSELDDMDEYARRSVNHSAKEYVGPEGQTTNSVEGFFSQLRRTIEGTHISVSLKHLAKYAKECEFHFNCRQNPASMLPALLTRLSRPVCRIAASIRSISPGGSFSCSLMNCSRLPVLRASRSVVIRDVPL